MILNVPWPSVEERLKEVAEGAVPDPSNVRQDEILTELGLIDGKGLTADGDSLFMATHVVQDQGSASEVLGDVLLKQPIVHALLEALWPVGTAPVSGALSMIKRLTQDPNDTNARRWLNTLNQAGLIAYNRAKPTLRILANPAELVPEEESESKERERAHLLSKDTPYGNLMALRELLRAARRSIRWWEQHMPGKILEVLHRELDGEKVQSVRLLSGPANINQDVKDDYKRFRTEMKQQRGIDVEWRVLARKEAFEHHDRFFITEGMSRNLPPLNTILAGSTGEILPSELEASDFDQWWSGAIPLSEFVVDTDSS